MRKEKRIEEKGRKGKGLKAGEMEGHGRAEQSRAIDDTEKQCITYIFLEPLYIDYFDSAD